MRPEIVTEYVRLHMYLGRSAPVDEGSQLRVCRWLDELWQQMADTERYAAMERISAQERARYTTRSRPEAS